MSTLLYIEKIPALLRESFQKRVGEIAKALKIDNPNILMQLFNAESGVNPAAENKAHPFKNGFATGLIQFTPDTAIGLGVTTMQLKVMDAVKQLDYVYKYFKSYAGRINNYPDLYLVTFLPAMVGKSGDDVFEIKGLSRGAIAKSNPVIDINKDGKITYNEFQQYVRNTVPGKYKDVVFGAVPVVGPVNEAIGLFRRVFELLQEFFKKL